MHVRGTQQPCNVLETPILSKAHPHEVVQVELDARDLAVVPRHRAMHVLDVLLRCLASHRRVLKRLRDRFDPELHGALATHEELPDRAVAVVHSNGRFVGESFREVAAANQPVSRHGPVAARRKLACPQGFTNRRGDTQRQVLQVLELELHDVQKLESRYSA